jgi:hypothetical protein
MGSVGTNEKSGIETPKEVLQDDVIRKIIDLAVQTGRALKKTETGFLHYHPQHLSDKLEEQVSLSIPTYENFLFCLALLRTKKMEAILEAKELLDRLLAFQIQNGQNRSPGNFPQYLHEYPYARDHFLAVRLLLPFFWIEKEFLHVLGDALSKKFLASYEALKKYLETLSEQLLVDQVSLPHWVKFACAKEAKPIESVSGLAKIGPQMLGELLAYMQIRGVQDSEFTSFVLSAWHKATKKFVGSPLLFSQAGLDVQPTLFDYYMGAIDGALSQVCQKPNIQALTAALIHPLDIKIGNFARDDIAAFSTCAMWLQKEEVQKNSFAPFYLVLPHHTLSFEVPKGAHFKGAYVKPEKADDLVLVSMEFDLLDTVFGDNIEEAVACSFFINNRASINIVSEGVKATSISAKAPICLTVDNHSIEITWKCVSGDAEFMAHPQRGNRQNQVLAKGKDRFSAFDWQILLRGIRCREKVRLKVEVKVRVLNSVV